MKTRPEKPSYPVWTAINAEGMGGLMRFLNHSCRPAAEFKEVANHRRTTVVVATTQDIRTGAATATFRMNKTHEERVKTRVGAIGHYVGVMSSNLEVKTPTFRALDVEATRKQHPRASKPNWWQRELVLDSAAVAARRDQFSHFAFCLAPRSPPIQARPPCHLQASTKPFVPMVKHSGSTNYTAADIDRLLSLIEQALPLGKDEWERLAASFNANRTRGAPERDFESLRRKFKSVPWSRTSASTSTPTRASSETAKTCSSPATRPLAGRPRKGLSAPTSPSVASSRSSNLGEFQELLASPLVLEGAGDAARTPRPAPPPVATCARRAGLGGVSKARTTAHESLATNASQHLQQQSARALASRREADKYPKLQNYSNRLGGQDLSTFRDTIGVKRANEDDKETQEASFAKAKRIRAMRTTTALKTKLAGIEAATSNMGGGLFEMLLHIREENERKAEERRVVEEKRHREDVIAQEARLRVEKAEAEERRRQEKIEREVRARRDRDEARARTQELVMLIDALKKNS
ncbi:hypothetical protein PF007_g12367 [Phytophthora fragariae]|uniref:Uncharacterized protein n=3 Tax=Phytophthora fragariae TaxID=53985 RepID=A0A6A3S4R4_9STRA|nr:hypothetical protein PF007_g12367 [Phytophthora fragariae]